jgi:DNA-binding PadR family transcriptional regulator
VSPTGRRAKFYRLTAAGRDHLKQESREWKAYVAAVASVMETRTQPV